MRERKVSAKAKQRREAIVCFLFQYEARRGMAPNIREIGEAVNIPSTSTTNYYLDALVKEAYIKRLRFVSRGNSLTRSGQALARKLMGIKDDICHHCGAPVDDSGRYKPKEAKIKLKPIRAMAGSMN